MIRHVLLCVATHAHDPAQPNRSLIDGISVLLAAADADQPVGVGSVVDWIETTRTQRLLATLAHCGLLRQGEDRRYLPGPGLPVLSAIAMSRLHVLPAAVPLMNRVAKHYDCTVALGTLWRDRVAYLAVTKPDRDAAAAVGANKSFPIADSAIGILLLGWQDSDYANTHGVSDSHKQAQAAQAAGHARCLQKDNRLAVAFPIAESPAPTLAVAASFDRNHPHADDIGCELQAIALAVANTDGNDAPLP